MLKAYAVIIIIVLLVSAVIGAWLWPYTINSWLDYAGKEPCVTWWQGMLIGFCPVIGQITIPAAVITWVLMMVL